MSGPFLKEIHHHYSKYRLEVSMQNYKSYFEYQIQMMIFMRESSIIILEILDNRYSHVIYLQK